MRNAVVKLHIYVLLANAVSEAPPQMKGLVVSNANTKCMESAST